ncbi:MAG TPA: hypothetical protein V6C97_12295 [Oculatellaceae cyanobacterium]
MFLTNQSFPSVRKRNSRRLQVVLLATGLATICASAASAHGGGGGGGGHAGGGTAGGGIRGGGFAGGSAHMVAGTGNPSSGSGMGHPGGQRLTNNLRFGRYGWGGYGWGWGGYGYGNSDGDEQAMDNLPPPGADLDAYNRKNDRRRAALSAASVVHNYAPSQPRSASLASSRHAMWF